MSLAPKCPRCGAAVTAQADDLGFLNCEGCGTRLRRAPTIKLTIQSPTPSSAAAAVPAAAVPPLAHAGNRETDATDSLLARIERVDASATLPPGLKSNLALKAAGFGQPAVAPTTPPPASASTLTVPPGALVPPLDAVQGLLVLMQSVQKDLASLVQRHDELCAAVARLAASQVTPPTPARAPQTQPLVPKAAGAVLPSVLIVEDDALIAEQIRASCVDLGLDPTVVTEASAALASLSRERPALVIVEPLLPGDPSGLDLVNQVKATIEWLAIPILVHTRAPIANHEQARNDFGADDYVLKSEDSVETLTRKVARLLA